jgi:hypothetical protein
MNDRFAPETAIGCRKSGAAKLGWSSHNGVVAIDPHTTLGDVAWDHSLAGTNDDMSRFGMMRSCGGVRRSTEGNQKA